MEKGQWNAGLSFNATSQSSIFTKSRAEDNVPQSAGYHTPWDMASFLCVEKQQATLQTWLDLVRI